MRGFGFWDKRIFGRDETMQMYSDYEGLSLKSCIVWVGNIFIYIPATQMTSIFEGRPPKNKAFSNQNKGHLMSFGSQVYIK